MLKKILFLGALSASALLSAGYWDVLNDDPERAEKIAQLSQEDQEALYKACTASDLWQEESQGSISKKAEEHRRGFEVMRDLLGAREIRAHSELVCFIPGEETRGTDTIEDRAEEAPVNVESQQEAA